MNIVKLILLFVFNKYINKKERIMSLIADLDFDFLVFSCFVSFFFLINHKINSRMNNRYTIA